MRIRGSYIFMFSCGDLNISFYLYLLYSAFKIITFDKKLVKTSDFICKCLIKIYSKAEQFSLFFVLFKDNGDIYDLDINVSVRII